MSAVVPILLALALGEVAHGAPAAGVRSREPLPAREVERGLASPRGWSQTTFVLSRRAGGATVLDDRRLFLDHGLTDRLELRLALSHRSHRSDDCAHVGLADPRLAARWTAIEAPLGGRWVTVELGVRSPLGADHPNPEAGGGPPLSQPTTELDLEGVARQRWGALRVDIGLRATAALDGRAGLGEMAIEFCDQVWDSPVVRVRGGLEGGAFAAALLQAGPLQARARVDAVHADPRRLGEDTPQILIACAEPEDLPGGDVVDGTVGGALQVSRGLQLDGWVRLPLAGRIRRYHLVDHGPGTTAGVGLEVAW